MLTQKAIKEKLFELPNEFTKYYEAGKFAQAKSCFDTAITVSVFCELEESDQIKLFGGRSFDREDTGLFNERLVQKCQRELIRNPR